MTKIVLACLVAVASADYDFANEPPKVHWTRHDKYDSARVKSRAGKGVGSKPTIMSMDVTYTVDGDEYEGYVAYPTAPDPKRPDGFPGMVISHAWYGLAEGEKMRAEEAAKHGYVAFALDMYGKGKRATDRAGAMQLIGELNANGPEVVKMRAEAGLDQLRAGGVVSEMAVVDESLIYSTGYCAGAIWATEMARSDWGVKGVSVFHANYANLTAFTTKMADVWMQYHHASYDRVGDEGLLELETYLEGADVKVWETVKYGGTYHGFSDPTNSIFDDRAAAQSHASMFAFFKASMPKPACEDSTTWHKNGNEAKNCGWVAEWSPRCDVKGEGRVLAKDACPCACPLTRLPL